LGEKKNDYEFKLTNEDCFDEFNLKRAILCMDIDPEN